MNHMMTGDQVWQGAGPGGEVGGGLGGRGAEIGGSVWGSGVG